MAFIFLSLQFSSLGMDEVEPTGCGPWLGLMNNFGVTHQATQLLEHSGLFVLVAEDHGAD